MNIAIEKICETASVPFVKLRTSDQLKFVPKLSVFLDSLRYQFIIYSKKKRPLLYNP